MQITLANDDPFANNVRVTDSNANDAVVFNGRLESHEEVQITCTENGANFGNIITYQDNNQGVGRVQLSDGDRVSL